LSGAPLLEHVFALVIFSEKVSCFYLGWQLDPDPPTYEIPVQMRLWLTWFLTMLAWDRHSPELLGLHSKLLGPPSPGLWHGW
jgi:hypothetical protein